MFSPLPSRRSSAVVVAGALIALAAIACRKRESSTVIDSAAGMDTMAPAAAAPNSTLAPTLTDPQIVQIVMTANSGDSSGGALARAKAKSSSVKGFGQMMVRDHGDLNTKLADVARTASITPEENATSRQLKNSADSVGAALGGMSGADFDRAYIDREVQVHQMVLDQLDQQLIPTAQNANLKSLLQSARPTISAHLDRAKALQSAVGATSTKP